MTLSESLHRADGPAAGGFTQPAEFEAQSAVWMGWPKEQWYTPDIANTDTRVPIADIIQALTGHGVPVRLMCTDRTVEVEIRDWYALQGRPIPDLLDFVPIDHVDIWQRDMGPIFLKDGAGNLAVAGFRQNEWGYDPGGESDYSQRSSRIAGHVRDHLGITTFFSSDLFSEGGDRICDGQGTLLVCRAVEVQRNPDATIAEIEEALRDTLGVTRIIWIDDGIVDDLHSDWGPIPYPDGTGGTILLYGPQTTGGHLDELVRFAPGNTIVLAQVQPEEAASDPIMAVNYARLEKTFRLLSHETNAAGEAFKIVRIPVPKIEYMQITRDQPMYFDFLQTLIYPESVPQFPADGSPVHVVKAASYANYLVTNNVVIGQGYGDTQKENELLSILKDAYGRSVVLIDSSALNYCGGGIHCVTQQQPDGIIV